MQKEEEGERQWEGNETKEGKLGKTRRKLEERGVRARGDDASVSISSVSFNYPGTSTDRRKTCAGQGFQGVLVSGAGVTRGAPWIHWWKNWPRDVPKAW